MSAIAAARSLPDRSTVDQYWHETGFTGVVARAGLRTLQFVFAVVVAGLYGVDLHFASERKESAESAWIYAEVVAALTILTCATHCFVTVKRVVWIFWDFVLCVLWAAQFGVYATIYLQSRTQAEAQGREEYDATSSVTRMKVAVWIDLINMVLWLASFVQGIAWCCVARRITRKTGRIARPESAGDSKDEQEGLQEAEKNLPGDIDDEMVKSSIDSGPIPLPPPSYRSSSH